MNERKFSKVTLLSFLITGILSNAATITEANEAINTNKVLEAGTYEGEVNNGGYVVTQDGTVFNGEVTFRAKTTGGESYVELKGNNTIDTLNIDIKPNDNVNYAKPKGLIVRGNSNATIDTLRTNVVYTNKTADYKESADSAASYGVAVGYDYNGGSSTDLAKLTVNNLNVKVENTADTIITKRTVSQSIFGLPISATIDFGHQLSGLKVYRKDGARAEFIANDTASIKVNDISDKKIGDYLVGAYVSGTESKATFNGDTEITISSNGVNSAAVKVGKPFDNVENGKEGPSAIFNGKTTIDTTNTKDSASIRLFNDKSKLEITGLNTDEESVIKSGNSAVVFDTKDYVLNFKSIISGKVSRNSNANDQVVKLNNTKITTTSETSSLIVSKAERVIDPTFGRAGRFSDQLNSGVFVNKNATFELTGEKSSATAASNGWLMEAQSVSTNAASSLNASIKDKAVVTGLITKGNDATLNLNLENDATWVLAKKGDIDKTSTLSVLKIDNSKLDATNKNVDNKSDYIIKADNVINNTGTITLVNDSYEDKLVIEGDYVANNGKLLVNTEWNTPGTTDYSGTNSKTDVLEIKGTASGKTVIETVDADGNEKYLDGSISAIIDNLAKTKAVVKVDNDINPGRTFTGKVSSKSASEIWLSHRNVDGKTEYYWEVKKIIDKVPNYVVQPSLVYEQGYATLDTLNERKGNFVKIEDATQVWSRLYGKYLAQEGKERVKHDTSLVGFQAGIEKVKDNKHTGAYLSYTGSLSDINGKTEIQVDENTPYEYTGRINTHGISLGVTHTRYKEDGAYLDLVGQLSYYLSNIYDNNQTYLSRANSLGLVLSAEVGKPYYFKNNKYIIEPQAQIIYQATKTLSLNDGIRDVSFAPKHGLRARVGARIMGVESNFYGLANLWVDISNRSNVNIGQDKLKEGFSNFWLELGVGSQKQLDKNLYIYADARVEVGLNGRLGAKANIGIKKEW